MEFMKEAVQDGQEEKGRAADKCEATIECVEGGEYFCGIALRMIYRSHACQDHRGIDERIVEVQVHEMMVA